MQKSWSRRDALKALGISLGSAVLPMAASAKNENGQNILLPQKNILLDKPMTVITIGAGNRGNVYGVMHYNMQTNWILLV